MKILLIAGDKAFSKMVAFFAANEGLEVDSVHSAADAAASLTDRSYEGFIIDESLPDGSGADLARTIRENRGGGIPIGMVSNASREAGAFDTISGVPDANFILNKSMPKEQLTALFKHLYLGSKQSAINSKGVLAQSKAEYDATIADKIKDLDERIHSIVVNPSDKTLKDLKSYIHMLGETAGTYGYTNVTESCQPMERLIEKSLSAKVRVPMVWSDVLYGFLREIKFFFQMQQWVPSETAAGDQVLPAYAKTGDIMVITADEAFARDLQNLARVRGVEVTLFNGPNAAEKSILDPSYHPHFMIVDREFPGTETDGYDLITSFKGVRPTIVTVFGVVTDREDVEERIKAANLGVELYLTRPLNPIRIVERYLASRDKSDKKEFNVLLIDADENFGKEAVSILRQAGIPLSRFSSGKIMFDKIKEVQPQLLLLDVDIPEFGGFDLLKALRSDSRYGDLPVLMVTKAADHSSAQVLFDAGADGIIFKPFDPMVFQAEIQSWKRRSQVIEAHRSRDFLTDLYNRRAFRDYFEIAASSSLRDGTPLSFAIFDIDNFKSVNDRFGHLVGDEVLSKMGGLLRTAFRKDDVVARWGGEEFVVMFRNLNPPQACLLMGLLLEEVRSQHLITSQPDVKITFSCGVAGFPADGQTLGALSNAADEALLRAKDLGKNRVVNYHEPSIVSHEIELPKLLIVESDPETCDLLRLAFQTIGFQVTVVRNLKLAEKELRAVGSLASFSLVVIDRKLPDGDGLRLMQSFHKLGGEIPVLALGEQGDPIPLEGIPSEAYVDYINKPFTLPGLFEKISQLWARRDRVVAPGSLGDYDPFPLVSKLKNIKIPKIKKLFKKRDSN